MEQRLQRCTYNIMLVHPSFQVATTGKIHFRKKWKVEQYELVLRSLLDPPENSCQNSSL